MNNTKYDAKLYLTLNYYGYSNESLANIKTYLQSQTLPGSLNTTQKKTRFIQKWEPSPYTAYPSTGSPYNYIVFISYIDYTNSSFKASACSAAFNSFCLRRSAALHLLILSLFFAIYSFILSLFFWK